MRKSLLLTALAASALISLPSWGARKATRAAEESPIITIKCDAYNVVGAENSFGLMLGAIETDYFDIDCGFGMEEMEVNPWTVENGAIVGTYKSVRVSEEGLIRIYGDPEKIDMIQLQGGYATEIEMDQCRNLEVLDLSHNTLKKLDLTPFTNLYAIYLSDNPFTKETPLKVGAPKNRLAILEIDICEHLDQSFNLSDYPAMQAFDAYHNTDLWNLDPTGCPELLTLSLELTNVSSLDVSKNPKLISLNISETRIPEIDLSNNPLLSTFMADHVSGFINKGYRLNGIDLTKNPELKILYLGGNMLESLDLSKNPQLTNINLTRNKLTSLDFSGNPNLYSVTINFNDMDFATLPAPQETWGEYFYLQNDIPVSRSIGLNQPLDLSSKVLRPGTQTTAAVWIKGIDGNNVELDPSLYTYADGVVTFTELPTDSVFVKYSNSLLADYQLSTTPFLVRLPEDLGKPHKAVSMNAGSAYSGTMAFAVGMYGATPESPKKFMVDFGNSEPVEFTATSSTTPASPNVAGQVVQGNDISIILPEGEVITALGIDQMPVSSIDLTQAPELRELSITNAGLNIIDLRFNRCLETLCLDDNSLTELDLAGLYANWEKNVLTDFSAARNYLSTVNITAPTQIEKMDLSNNRIEEFSLKNYDNMKNINLSGNLLSDEVSLAYLMAAETIDLSRNNISRVVYDSFSNLETLDLSGNRLTIETLPYQPEAANYIYAPQQPLQLLKNAPAVNLSDQNRVIDGKGTDFVWKKADGSLLVEGTDLTCTDGATRFLDTTLGEVYCEMTNPAFPELKDANVFRTTNVNVVGAPTNVLASFTTTEDSEAGEVIVASDNGTAIYIDWRGDGSEYVPYEATAQDFYNSYTEVRTFKNANVKVYTYDSAADLQVLSFYGIKMSEFDGEALTGLHSFALSGAGLSADNIKLPDTDLLEFNFSGNNISQYPWFEKYPNLKSLNLSNNDFETIDISLLKKLEVCYVINNKLTDIKFDNPLLWELAVASNELETLDLTGLKKLSQLWVSNNRLSELNISAFRGTLTTLSCTNNRFTFATLPVPTDYPRLVNYTYGNQEYINAEISDDFMTFDLSSQAMVKDMYETVYTWFLGEPEFNADEGTLSGETLIVDDEYTIKDGVTTFNYKFSDDVVCVMTNSLFPQIYLRTPAYRVGYSAVEVIEGDTENRPVDVYTLSGMIVKRQVAPDDALLDLTPGIYIVGGKKVYVK